MQNVPYNVRDNAMKSLICLLVLFVCICHIDALQAQTLMIDNFDKEPINVGKKYPKYVGTQEGYDIYYEKANVKLSKVLVNPKDTNDKALRVDFNLPPAFSWGNWVSVRREFKSPLNLNEYKGLELNLWVEVASPNTILRITLSDLTDDSKSGDEMWWFDCDPGLLRKETEEWVYVKIPFNSFRVSYGEGTRHNDHKFNLKKIVAYEINLVSAVGKNTKGIILLDSLRAYK